MKVYLWGINYAPELTGIAPYNVVLARHLRDHGHAVHMVTSFAYYPAWRKDPSDKHRLYRTDDDQGIPIHRCWHYVPSRVSAIKRILHEGSFVATSFLRLLTLEKPDVLVVVSPPLLLGAAAWVVSRLRRCPYVFHVQDMQPDAAVGLGMLKPGMLTRLLYGLESLAYRKAARVSGISDGMMEAFRRKGVPPEKILYFPNGVVVPERAAIGSTGVFRRNYNYGSGDFLAVYSGNLGMKQGLSILVEAARLVHSPRIRLVICGDGAARPMLAEAIEKASLKNTALLPLQSEADYHHMLRDADVILIPQQQGSGASFLPSKLLPALAYAKPILAVADDTSALAQAMRVGLFGRCVAPAQPEQLAFMLDNFVENVGQLRQMGERGREYVQQFEMNRVLSAYREELEKLANPSHATA